MYVVDTADSTALTFVVEILQWMRENEEAITGKTSREWGQVFLLHAAYVQQQLGYLILDVKKKIDMRSSRKIVHFTDYSRRFERLFYRDHSLVSQFNPL